MNKRSLKLKRVHNEAKQNIAENGHIVLQPEPKRKPIRKAQHHQLHALLESHSHKNPLQLRHLCEQQEKLVLAEYKSNRLFNHNEFYEFVKCELADSKICSKIMMIKAMTNEEAQEELDRIQEIRGKYGAFSYNFAEASTKGEDDEEEVKMVFKHCGKKASMIEQNDDVYLEELGAGRLHQIEQEDQHFEDEGDREKQEARPLSYSHFSSHQYYQNDDVFEF